MRSSDLLAVGMGIKKVEETGGKRKGKGEKGRGKRREREREKEERKGKERNEAYTHYITLQMLRDRCSKLACPLKAAPYSAYQKGQIRHILTLRWASSSCKAFSFTASGGLHLGCLTGTPMALCPQGGWRFTLAMSSIYNLF